MKHGHAKKGHYTPEYIAWQNMRQRCGRPTHPHFDRYGGRGIAICERWSLYSAFYEDVGPRLSNEHSLGRVDNDKGYEPGNVRWETKPQQQRNTRHSRTWTVRGLTFNSHREAAAHFKVPPSTLRHWIKRKEAFGDFA